MFKFTFIKTDMKRVLLLAITFTVLPYLSEIQEMYESLCINLLTSAFSVFHWKSANFAISRNTDIECILILHFDT